MSTAVHTRPHQSTPNGSQLGSRRGAARRYVAVCRDEAAHRRDIKVRAAINQIAADRTGPDLPGQDEDEGARALRLGPPRSRLADHRVLDVLTGWHSAGGLIAAIGLPRLTGVRPMVGRLQPVGRWIAPA